MATSQEELDSSRVFQSLKQVVSALVQNFECDDEALKINFNVDAEPFEVAFRFAIHPCPTPWTSSIATLLPRLSAV